MRNNTSNLFVTIWWGKFNQKHNYKYRVYENDWSGFEVDYIHKYGEQNYKH